MIFNFQETLFKLFLTIIFLFSATNPLNSQSKFDPNTSKSCIEYFKTGRKKKSCARQQQLSYLTLGGAIATCGYQNGLLEKDEVWPFAIENLRFRYAKQGLTLDEKFLAGTFDQYFYGINTKTRQLISAAGGCNNLLKYEYPSFVRKEAPSKEDIRETMQDTPFQW